MRRDKTVPRKVGVVGAGVAGLTCARALIARGVEVTLFDKGRAPGGRLATRRIEGLTFDLGAQYFTARDPRFVEQTRAWIDAGVAAPWEGRVGAVDGRGHTPRATPALARFVGVPTMSAVGRALAEGLEVRAGHRVDELAPHADGILLRGVIDAKGATLGPRGSPSAGAAQDLGAFDAVVVAVPPEQARALLADRLPALEAALAAATSEPCVALGFVCDDAALAAAPFDGIFVGRDGDLDRHVSWIARDGSKPGRRQPSAWVVHAAPEWSRAHLRDPDDAIAHELLQEVARILAIGPLRASVTTLQRWALARPAARGAQASRGLSADDPMRVAVGGDWAAGGRVEGAFLSGLELARWVLGDTTAAR